MFHTGTLAKSECSNVPSSALESCTDCLIGGGNRGGERIGGGWLDKIAIQF